jgi:hypothetical protein
MSRPKNLSKTKLLRRQLRESEKEAQTRYDAINRIVSEKQRQIESLKSRLSSIGVTSVHETPPGEVYCVAVQVDRRAMAGLKQPGHFLAELANQLFTKLVREMPELSGPVPQLFFGKMRNLPTTERNARLRPFYEALRLRVYNDHSTGTGGCYPFITDPDTSELYETFCRTLSFRSFCRLLELLEEHAHLIHP